MPRKFSIGLGNVPGIQGTSIDGVRVSVGSGSQSDRALDGGNLVFTTPGQIPLEQTLVSADSVPFYHSTLFEDFDIDARGVYNFYTPDEQVNPNQDTSASLGDIARYVEVRWTPTPTIRVFFPKSKGVKPDPRPKPPTPVMPISQAKGAVANGYVSPGVVTALLVDPISDPNPSRFDEDLFLFSEDAAGLHASDHVASESDFHVTPIASGSARTRVSFIDPSIGGAIDGNRIGVASDHVHLATLGALSKIIAPLEVISEFNQDVPLRNAVPSFPASPDLPDVLYMGYILERYTLGPDGSMSMTKVVDIDRAEQKVYIDRDVVFGGRYAYRIRSIAQWCHSPLMTFGGQLTTDRLPEFDTSAGLLTRRASFYYGNWSDWSRTEVRDNLLPDPPDELTVRPISRRGQVHITWRMPNDPQRDIRAVRLVRALMVGDRLSPWSLLGEFIPANGMFIDRDVTAFEDGHTQYIYAMYSLSYHGELSPLSERIMVRLTNLSQYRGEEPVVQLGPRGGDPTALPVGRDPVPETELVARDSVTAYIRGARSALPLFGREYVIEVQSLATGERVDVALSVDTTDVGTT